MEIGALLSNLGILLGLLWLSGFFSGSETALSSLSKIVVERLRRDRSSKTSAEAYPRNSDSVEVGRHTIAVLEADLRTIKKVRITRTKTAFQARQET